MGGARRGRRDNGLVATEYAIAGDVDPRVGEHLLDVLAAGGIAAYLQPSADLHPVTRTTTMPARPTDRLYVDREHVATARDYLAQLAEPDPARPDASRSGTGGMGTGAPASPAPAVAGAEAGVTPDRAAGSDLGAGPEPGSAPAEPGTGPDRAGAERTGLDRAGAERAVPAERGPADADLNADVDEAFARIVASLRADMDSSTQTWPDGTDADKAAGPTPRVLERRRLTDQPSLLDGLDTFGADLPDDEDDEGSYTPPPPPPLPRPSAAAVIAVIAIVAGFVLFLSPSLAPFDADLARVLGFAGCAAGFGTLIWRLRPGNEDDEDSDPDDGAVV